MLHIQDVEKLHIQDVEKVDHWHWHWQGLLPLIGHARERLPPTYNFGRAAKRVSDLHGPARMFALSLTVHVCSFTAASPTSAVDAKMQATRADAPETPTRIVIMLLLCS